MYSRENENTQLFQDFVENDDNSIDPSAYYGSYLIMILYRLKIVLLKDASLIRSLINIRCYINSESYRGRANYHRSPDGRSEGIICTTNSLTKAVTLPRSASDDTNKVMVFSNKNCLINLSAIVALLGGISPSYGGQISRNLNKKLARKHNIGFSNTKHGIPSTPEQIIQSKMYCTTKLPIIDDISFCEHDQNKNPSKIGWFEKYNNTEHARYDADANIALQEYKSMLSINDVEYTR